MRTVDGQIVTGDTPVEFPDLDEILSGIQTCIYSDRSSYRIFNRDDGSSNEFRGSAADIHSHIYLGLYGGYPRMYSTNLPRFAFYNARLISDQNSPNGNSSLFIQCDGDFYRLTMPQDIAASLVEMLKIHPQQIQAVLGGLGLPVSDYPRYAMNLATGQAPTYVNNFSRYIETFVDSEKELEIVRNLIPMNDLLEQLAGQIEKGEECVPALELSEIAASVRIFYSYGKSIFRKTNQLPGWNYVDEAASFGDGVMDWTSLEFIRQGDNAYSVRDITSLNDLTGFGSRIREARTSPSTMDVRFFETKDSYNYSGMVNMVFSIYPGRISLTDSRENYTGDKGSAFETIIIPMNKYYALDFLRHMLQSRKNLSAFFDHLLGAEHNLYFRPQNIPLTCTNLLDSTHEQIAANPEKFCYQLPETIAFPTFKDPDGRGMSRHLFNLGE